MPFALVRRAYGTFTKNERWKTLVFSAIYRLICEKSSIDWKVINATERELQLKSSEKLLCSAELHRFAPSKIAEMRFFAKFGHQHVDPHNSP